MVDFKLKLFLFVTVLHFVRSAENITATGGGIVKPGDDLVMSYNVGQPWDRCFWFWYKNPSSPYFCSFDQADDGTVKIRKCNLESLKSVMAYTPKLSKTECGITVKNVSEMYNTTWAVRLEEDLYPKTISIEVASPITNVSIHVAKPLEASTVGTVECIIVGGRPAPRVQFHIGSPNQTYPNNTQVQVPDEKGVYTTHQSVTFTPNITDHGRPVTCKAAVYDGNEAIIWDWVDTGSNYSLNVTFPPQPIANKTLTGYKDKNITISFEFRANPMPTDLKWVIVKPMTHTDKPHGKSGPQNDSNATIVTLLPGTKNDKYLAAQLETEDDINFRSELVILKLGEIDATFEYHLEVKNSFGAQDYFFILHVEQHEPNTTTTTSTTPGPTTSPHIPTREGNHTAVYVVVVLLILSAVVLIAIIIYKKKIRNNETAPLTH